MAQIDLGKLKFQWQGLWQTATAYEVDDVVHDDGSTFVCVTAVPNTNTVRPGENDSFEIMARGVNFRGEYDAQATYLHLEIVTHNLASWISIQSEEFTGQEPAEGSAFWALLTPAPAESVVTTAGDLVYVNNENNAARLPIRQAPGVSLVTRKAPLQTFERGATYSVGTATPATAILTDFDDAQNVQGDNDNNGTITVTRGYSYDFTFPANSKLYSIKDPADAGYTTLGGGGRLTNGTSPSFISNGGTIRFSPDANTPNTVVIRDELGGTDEITVTVVDLRYEPTWEPGSVRSWAVKQMGNCQYNTYTESLAPLPAWAKKFGRGNIHTRPYHGYWANQVITEGGDLLVWGNNYNDGTTFTNYNSNGLGSGTDGIIEHPMKMQFRMPAFWMRALAGNADDAKWLTDEFGNSFNYTSGSVPKVKETYRSSTGCFVLMENGLLFVTGYMGYGATGNGISTNERKSAHVVQFYDETTTALVGADRPRITQFIDSRIQDGTATTTSSYFAIDEDGHLYAWGYNQYGQLADGTQSNNFFARRVDPNKFNNERIIFISCSDGRSQHLAVITETGKCFTWGRATHGQCGTGSNPSHYTNPQDVTAISGSPLNGKKIIHVNCANSGQDIGRTYYMTDEGIIYYSGYSASHGIYSGVYSSTATNHQLTPIGLTDASTTYLSDNQKAVQLWVGGGRYSPKWIITDGGDSNQPKCYAFGGNASGAQGTDSSTTSGQSTTSQGNWFLSEVRFETAGDGELSNNTDNVRPNTVVATQYDAALTNELVIGNIVKVVKNNGGDSTDSPSIMLDSNGRLFLTGYKSDHNWVNYIEWQHENDWRAASDFGLVWYPLWGQPEPAVDFITIKPNSGQAEMLQFIGESGTLWYAGHSTWNCAPNNKTSGGIHPFPHFIGSY